MFQTFHHLLFFVSVKTMTTAKAETINLHNKPQYLHLHGRNLVNFDTCKGFDFLGEEPDPDYPDDCHVSQLEAEESEAIMDQVKPCCPSPATYLGSAR